jgi:primosomal protein N' (replication factor Y)
MVYHADHGKLVCHYCGKQLPPLAICSSCGSHDIRFVGFGTKAVEAGLNQQFPKASVARLDADIHKLTDISKILSDMNAGHTDILVGTQMISRGLDFDRVSLVGVISAESALSIPDFSASERAFDMMVQAAGRAGRRRTQGQVIIQTYNPQQPVLQAVAERRANP